MPAQERLEAVVPGERDPLQRAALVPRGAVLGAETVGVDARGVDPEPRGDALKLGQRVADHVFEEEEPHPLYAELLEPRGDELRVAAAAVGHELLVVGITEVGLGEPVGLGEVVGERELGREPQADLLVAEERDRAAHRFAQDHEDARVGERVVDRTRHRRAPVEVRRCCFETYRARRGVGEVRVVHRDRFEGSAVASGEEVAGLLDRCRSHGGVGRERREEGSGPCLVHTRNHCMRRRHRRKSMRSVANSTGCPSSRT